MIIDTESSEGKALVALAKFGDKWLSCIDVIGGWRIGWREVMELARADGLLNNYLHRTDLAKLPEGL